MVSIEEHPLLDTALVPVAYPRPLGELTLPAELEALFAEEAEAPLQSDDEVRKAIRDLLRHGGYKPTGRGKPASEYLIRAASSGKLGTINVAVDLGNIVSLHSGVPISVVDLDRVEGELSIAIAAAESRYIFNLGGQEIDVGGLLCLHDSVGPCANAVKDAQRTKTDAATRRTLTIFWGSRELPGRTAETRAWFLELLAACGLEPA